MLKKSINKKLWKKKYKPWWFPYKHPFFKKRNKYYLNWKKNRFWKKYRFFFARKGAIQRIKFKKLFLFNLFKKKLIQALGASVSSPRLDFLISKKLGFKNLKQAQNLIKKGFILVNSTVVKEINYALKTLDVVSIKRESLIWKQHSFIFKKRKKTSHEFFISKRSPILVTLKKQNNNLNILKYTKFKW